MTSPNVSPTRTTSLSLGITLAAIGMTTIPAALLAQATETRERTFVYRDGGETYTGTLQLNDNGTATVIDYGELTEEQRAEVDEHVADFNENSDELAEARTTIEDRTGETRAERQAEAEATREEREATASAEIDARAAHRDDRRADVESAVSDARDRLGID